MSIPPHTSTSLQRILIIDGNAESRNMLSALLSGYFRKTELIFMASTTNEALEVLNTNLPSLVFMDVESTGVQGKTILEHINREYTDVVFTLEENNPAVQAFEFSDTKYITKPLRIEHLVNVMETLSSNQRLKNEQTPHQPHTSERITLKSHEGITCVDISNIRRLESDSNYTHFFLKTGERITISKTLKEYEDLLPTSHFFRTHQSHMVNLNLVKKFLKEDGGYALMDDGTQVLVSRRKKNGFLCALTA